MKRVLLGLALGSMLASYCDTAAAKHYRSLYGYYAGYYRGRAPYPANHGCLTSNDFLAYPAKRSFYPDYGVGFIGNPTESVNYGYPYHGETWAGGPYPRSFHYDW